VEVERPGAMSQIPPGSQKSGGAEEVSLAPGDLTGPESALAFVESLMLAVEFQALASALSVFLGE
jgi:hypothetical protein